MIVQLQPLPKRLLLLNPFAYSYWCFLKGNALEFNTEKWELVKVMLNQIYRGTDMVCVCALCVCSIQSCCQSDIDIWT